MKQRQGQHYLLSLSARKLIFYGSKKNFPISDLLLQIYEKSLLFTSLSAALWGIFQVLSMKNRPHS